MAEEIPIEMFGDSPTTKDELGFDHYADILLDSIENSDTESSPLTIGIHGKWGSGKTSLMRMLKKRFETTMYLFSWDNVPGKDNKRLLRFLREDREIGWTENATISKDGKTISISKDENSAEITIDEEEGKATLKISDVRTHDLKVKTENGELNIYEVSKDDNFKTIWFNAWAYGRNEPIGLALLQHILIEFQKEKGSKEKIMKLSESIGKLLTDAALRKTIGIPFEEVKELFKSSIEVKNTLRDDFKNAIDECLQDRRLIVFIDDLDRCLPEKSIEILEVIKLFLDVPKCVFVIGVEKEVIQKGIAVRYKSKGEELPISGKNYIEKIIQVPFDLPPIREEDMKKFIKNLGIVGKEEDYVEIVAKATEYNPRRVKMFLNTLRIKQAIAEKTGGEIKPDLCANLYVINYAFDKFYDVVVKHKDQHLLHKLERLAREQADKEKLEKELGGSSELLKEYYGDEDLKSLLKDEPYFNEYLFSWDAPKKDNKKLLEFLKKDLDIGWAEHAEILKPDDKTISISKDENSAEITIDEEKEKATLKISDGRIHDLKVITENGKPNIYNEIDINPYIYLSGTEAPPKEVPISGETVLNELLSGDSVRMNTAVDAIKKMPDSEKEKILDGVISKLKDKNEVVFVRKNAVSALGRIGDPGAVGALKWASEDEVVRKNAAETLRHIVDAQILALKDKDEIVRRNAALVLGSIGDPGAVDALIWALEDRDEVVRRDAALALGRIGDPGAVDALIWALRLDKDKFVRRDAALALGRIGDPEAVDTLIWVVGITDEVVRKSAAEALGRIGDEKAVNALLIVASKDEDEVVRRNAAEALGHIGDEKTVAALIERLKDRDEVVRRNAAEALGSSIGDPEAVDALIEALKDRDDTLSGLAAHALAEIGDARAVEALTKVLEAGYKLRSAVRRRAAEAREKIEAKQKSMDMEVDEG